MKGKSDFYASLLPLALITALMSLAAYWTPYALDNHLFEAGFLRRCPDGFTWGGFFNYADAIRQVDNWRLPNILAPVVSLYAPKWLFALLTGLAVALSAYAAASFSHGRPDGVKMHNSRFSFSFTIYVFAAMLLFLPWSNNLLTGDYAMNYIWGGAIALSMLLAARCGVGQRGGWLLPCVLGIILGMWHEGIALATVCGIAAFALAVRFDSRYIPYYIGGLATALVAVPWMAVSFLSERAPGEFISAAMFADPVHFIYYNALALLLLVLILYMLTSAKRRRILIGDAQTRPAFVLFAGASLSALALAAITACSGRAAYWGEMTAIAAFIIFFEPYLLRVRKVVAYAIGFVCLVLCAAEVFFCRAFDERYEAFVENVAKSPDGTVYGPVYLPKDFPTWLPQFVPRRLFVQPFTYVALSDRYAPRRAALVPVELGMIEFRTDTKGPVFTAEGNCYMMPTEAVKEPVVLDSLPGFNGAVFAIPFRSRIGEMVCLYPVE